MEASNVSPAQRAREFFAATLKVHLTRKGWSQSELARQAGLGRDLVSDYLNAKSLPSELNASRLAAAIGVSLSDLMPPQLSTGEANIAMEAFGPGVLRVRFDGVMPMVAALTLAQKIEVWTSEGGAQPSHYPASVALNVNASANKLTRLSVDVVLSHQRALEFATAVEQGQG